MLSGETNTLSDPASAPVVRQVYKVPSTAVPTFRFLLGGEHVLKMEQLLANHRVSSSQSISSSTRNFTLLSKQTHPHGHISACHV